MTTDFEFYYPLIESWLHVRAYPSADGLSVFFQDVTERKRVEESLAERERAALLGADVGLALTEGSDIRGMLQLCAEVVITGIRAGVAQGMVGLGVDLKDVATRRSLRDGIEFAEGLTGRRPARRS